MRPSASPSSKCCLGWKSNFGGVADLRSSLLALSSPTGTSSARHIGDGGEQSLERFVVCALLRLAVADRVLERGDLCHQRAWRGLVLGGLGLADLLRSGVAAGLRLLQFLNRCRGVARPAQDRFSRARSSKPRPVSQPWRGVRVLADPFDVEQGGACPGDSGRSTDNPSTKRARPMLPAVIGRCTLPRP